MELVDINDENSFDSATKLNLVLYLLNLFLLIVKIKIVFIVEKEYIKTLFVKTQKYCKKCFITLYIFVY